MFYIYLKYKHRIKNISKERSYYIFNSVILTYYATHIGKRVAVSGFLKGSRCKNFRELIKTLYGVGYPNISWMRNGTVHS